MQMEALENLTCSICGGGAVLLDVVDFNKSCAENTGTFLPLSGIPIYYAICPSCGFCFAPQMHRWTMEEFAERVYNKEYILVDPDYVESRPRGNAANIHNMLGRHCSVIRHLDFGGGGGLLARTLRALNWQSTSYDPFVDKGVNIADLGKFDLITAYEVFEHVPQVNQLMKDLVSLLAPNGLVMFSTMSSDGNIAPRHRLNWWYASPRNGHVSLFSGRSLALLGQKHGLKFGSFNPGFHVYFTEFPQWAQHFVAKKTNI
jgi:SAM-dependent methyltransferase